MRLKPTARCLQRWSSRSTGSITKQLEVARELIARFDAAQNLRPLFPAEAWLRRELKWKYLGLASLLHWLKAGETPAALSKI